MQGTSWVVASALAFALGCGRFDFAAQPDAAQRDAPGVDASPDSYAGLVLASAPRMYYRMSETAGTVAVDASGKGFDGEYVADLGTILLGQPGATTDGDTGVLLDADGNLGPRTQAELVVDPANNDWAGDFTVEVFVRPITAPPAGTASSIFVCEDYLNNGFRLGWYFTSALQFWTDQAAGTSTGTASITLSYAQYNHVALVHSGTSFIVYQDGNPVITIADASDYVPADAGSDCGLGSFHGMPANGVYDELAIYNRALTQAELAAHLAGR